MQNRNIYPYLVKSKASKKDGTCPIYISIHIDNKQAAAFSTKKKVAPKDWDDQKKCVKSTATNGNSQMWLQYKQMLTLLCKRYIEER